MSVDSRKESFAVLLATSFVAALHVAGFAGVRLDDAFITYRYGENIARGRGFVFNPGEHIWGTTSPGHALLAAAVHAIAGHQALPAAMSAAGALAWTAQAWLVYAIARRSVGILSAALVSLGIAAGAAGSHFFVPLETNLVAAAALGAVLLALSRRWVLAGLVVGVATVLRADAVLVGVPLLVLAARDLGWRAIAPVVAFAPLPVAWEAFAYAYFRALVPHTLGVKLHASTIASYAAHAARAPLDAIVPHAHASVTAGLGAWCVAGLGWVFAVRRDPRIAVLPAWGSLHVALYVLVLRPNVTFGWHLYPGTLAVALGGLYALAWAIEHLRAAWSRVAAVSIAAAATTSSAIVFSVDYPNLFWYGARDANDRSIAAYLRERARPGDVVDSEEVGTLAYYSDLAMVDHAGLVTPEERAAPAGPDQVQHHCRGLATVARLRFLVMSRIEVPLHACLLGAHDPIVLFRRRGIESTWLLWVADRDADRDSG